VRLFPEILKGALARASFLHWTLPEAGRKCRFMKASWKPLAPTKIGHILGSVAYADVPAVLQEHAVCFG